MRQVLPRLANNVTYPSARAGLRSAAQRNGGLRRAKAAAIGRWRRYPEAYFTDTVDLIMDNKHWAIPTYAAALKYSKMKRVRPSAVSARKGFRPARTCVAVHYGVFVRAGGLATKRLTSQTPRQRGNG
jgi:hypothetical protein